MPVCGSLKMLKSVHWSSSFLKFRSSESGPESVGHGGPLQKVCRTRCKHANRWLLWRGSTVCSLVSMHLEPYRFVFQYHTPSSVSFSVSLQTSTAQYPTSVYLHYDLFRTRSECGVLNKHLLTWIFNMNLQYAFLI